MIQQNLDMSHAFLAGGTIAKNTIVMFGADDDTVVVGTAQTDVVIGVALHAATVGQRVDVQLKGVSEVKLGGTVARGDAIASGAAGVGVLLVVTTASIRTAIGRAMASGVSGDVVPVILDYILAAPLT